MREKIIASILAIICLIALVGIYNFIPRNFSGFDVLTGITVAVQEKLDGKLLLSYQPWLQIGSTQSIYSEFVNIGTDPVTVKIEERVYGYVNGSLVPLAYYYDSQVSLAAGARRGFSTVFVPASSGLYYIQARATYNNKIIETWGVFTVYAPPATTVITVYSPVYSPGPAAAPPPPVGIPQINYTFPENVQLYKGGSALIDLTVKNTGGVVLHNLRLYISTASSINFEISPKQIASLDMNDSTLFLILVSAPLNATEGSYSFDFEIRSDEISGGKSILINVLSPPSSLEDELRHNILNAELLVTEIQREILSASSKGFNVDLASQSLKNAEKNLENAKNYFASNDFNRTREELGYFNKNVQDAVLQLASSAIFVYKAPLLPLYSLLLIIVIILIALLLIFLYWRKKKKEKRPRLLKELSETET
jgi:hypothetical protein